MFGCIWNTWTNFRSEFPHTIISKKVHINICPQKISFRGTAQQNVDLSPVDFHLWHTSKPLFILSSNWKWRHGINEFCYAFRNIHNLPGTFERVRLSWSDVSVRAFIQEKDIWKFVANCDSINHKKLPVLKLGTGCKYSMSVVSKITHR